MTESESAAIRAAANGLQPSWHPRSSSSSTATANYANNRSTSQATRDQTMLSRYLKETKAAEVPWNEQWEGKAHGY